MVINTSFYPLTSAIGTKLRTANLTAAEWRIWSYLVEIDSWGDRYQEFNTIVLLQQCHVSKATFYRAIAKFQELEIFDFQDNGFSVRNNHGVSSLKNEKPVAELRQDSQVCENGLKNEKPVAELRQDSQICEDQSLKPLQNKDSDLPQINKIYSDFKNSLSDSERESFLDFGKKKAAQLPKAPELPQKWIEKNWEELSAQWYKSTGKVSPSQNHKWETDPRTSDWLVIIEETANPLEFATDKEKQDFIRWCNETKQFSWLRDES
ncbi:hypothetical protein LC612_37055 [Nostoc sp. CHAB 5834]|nr:hypothetical protein [Nostoc sp. CHAB 5834]